jgi:hypothetical protein
MLENLRLTAEEEEWLLRAAFGSPRGVMPSSVVAALAAAPGWAKRIHAARST